MTLPQQPLAVAELAAASNFSFLRGASHPDEMVRQAAALGLAALGIADRNTLAGAVRAHVAAKEAGIRLVVGARLVLRCGLELLCFPRDRAAYGRLAKLLTLGNRRAPKGECHLDLADVAAAAEGQVFVLMPPARVDAAFAARAAEAVRRLGLGEGLGFMAASLAYGPDDAARLGRLDALAHDLGVRLMATSDALYHDPRRRPLQDVITCIREHVTVAAAGARLAAMRSGT